MSCESFNATLTSPVFAATLSQPCQFEVWFAVGMRGVQGIQGPPGTPTNIQSSGVTLPAEPYLNFTGTGITVTDDPANTRTTVNISVSGSQTPWMSTIDGAGHILQNVGQIGVGKVPSPTYSIDTTGDIVTGGIFRGPGGTVALMDPLTTKGDIVVKGSPLTTRQPIGIDGQVLTADSTQLTGMKWATPAAPGISGVHVQVAGIDVGTRPTLNFVNGAAAGDNSGSNRIDLNLTTQTPWLSTIDGATYLLNNVGGIAVGGTAAVGNIKVQSSSTASLWLISQGSQLSLTVDYTKSYCDINSNNFSSLRLAANSTSYINVTASSTVGVGVGIMAPLDCLHLFASGQNTGFRITNASNPIFQVYGNASGNDNGTLILYNAGVIGAYITAGGIAYFKGGTVGVGTSTPSYALDVVGDVNSTGVYRVNGTQLQVIAGAGLTGGGPLLGSVTLNAPVFVASGATHSSGICPDPGATAGTTRFLCENATWAVPAGGGGTPGGANTQIQFNNSGAFGGSANLTWDNTNNIESIKGTRPTILFDQGVSARARIQQVTTIPRIDLLMNAYYDGTNWQRDDTTQSSTSIGLLAATTNQVVFRYAPAGGSNPTAYTAPFLFDLANNVQTISGAVPMLLFDQGASSRSRLLQEIAGARLNLTTNLGFASGNWQRDDTSQGGMIIQMLPASIGVYYASPGANPAGVVNKFSIDGATGNVNSLGSYLINGVPISQITTQSANLNASRVLATNYRNTSGKTMFVSVVVAVTTSGQGLVAKTDSSATPAQIVAQQNAGAAAANVTVGFWVLNNNYYQVYVTSGGGTLNNWTEWT